MDYKENINMLFVDVFNDILQIEEKALKNSGLNNLSVKEMHVLEAIELVEEPTMSKVAGKLRVTIGTLTTAINTLVKKYYVERVECADDKRVVKLKLTDTGLKAYEVHKQFHDELISDSLNKLTDEEIRVLSSSLKKLRMFFVEQMGNKI